MMYSIFMPQKSDAEVLGWGIATFEITNLSPHNYCFYSRLKIQIMSNIHLTTIAIVIPNDAQK